MQKCRDFKMNNNNNIQLKHILAINGIEVASIKKEREAKTQFERVWELEKVFNKFLMEFTEGSRAVSISLRRYDHEGNMMADCTFKDCKVTFNDREWTEAICEVHHIFSIIFKGKSK